MRYEDKPLSLSELFWYEKFLEVQDTFKLSHLTIDGNLLSI